MFAYLYVIITMPSAFNACFLFSSQNLQRTKTQEAAELLSTFKVNAMAAMPPLNSHLTAASPGSEGRLLHEHLAGEDLVPLLQLDDRGRPGTPTSTGEHGGVVQLLFLHVMYGMSHSKSAAGPITAIACSKRMGGEMGASSVHQEKQRMVV